MSNHAPCTPTSLRSFEVQGPGALRPPLAQTFGLCDRPCTIAFGDGYPKRLDSPEPQCEGTPERALVRVWRQSGPLHPGLASLARKACHGGMCPPKQRKNRRYTILWHARLVAPRAIAHHDARCHCTRKRILVVGHSTRVRCIVQLCHCDGLGRRHLQLQSGNVLPLVRHGIHQCTSGRIHEPAWQRCYQQR